MIIVICVPECIFHPPPSSPSKYTLRSWFAQPAKEAGAMAPVIDDDLHEGAQKKVDLSILSEPELHSLILLVDNGVRIIEPNFFKDSKAVKELKKASPSLNEHTLLTHLKSMSGKGTGH